MVTVSSSQLLCIKGPSSKPIEIFLSFLNFRFKRAVHSIHQEGFFYNAMGFQSPIRLPNSFPQFCIFAIGYATWMDRILNIYFAVAKNNPWYKVSYCSTLTTFLD
jgi:hypothetical protein